MGLRRAHFWPLLDSLCAADSYDEEAQFCWPRAHEDHSRERGDHPGDVLNTTLESCLSVRARAQARPGGRTARLVSGLLLLAQSRCDWDLADCG